MKKKKFIKALGLQVSKIRKDKGISMYRLTKITGKTDTSIRRLEKGEISPSLVYLAEIADGLGVSIEELVKGL